MAELLEHGERRIDNSWAWAVGAADVLLDRLDDLVTVARLFGDEMENDQTKVAVREEPAEPGSAAMTMPSVTERSIVMAVFAAGETPVAVVVG